MENKDFKAFPKDFYWGAATAAYQIEGNNMNSDVWLMEQLPDTMYEELSGDCCDFYHRYEEDLDLFKELGLKMFRMGIEWSRIEPTPGKYSEAELDHYSRIIDACIERDIIPMITLQHFTSPIWLISMGGWKNPDTPRLFANYSKKVMERLGDRVKWVCTINEANTPLQLNINGLMAGDIKEKVEKASISAAKYFNVEYDEFAPFFPNATDELSIKNVIEAHRLAVDEIHRLDMDIKTGVTLSLQDMVFLEDSEEGEKVFETVNKRLLKDMGSIGDFVGVQNYTSIYFNRDGKLENKGNLSNTGIEMTASSLAAVCKLAQEITNKPVFITEHGADLDNSRDNERIDFIKASLEELYKEMENGLDILGYLHWSFHDNFEWFRGYKGEFGLVKIDWPTQKRMPRPSAKYLGNISKNNGFI